AEERGRAVVHEALSRLTPPKRRALAACWQARGDRASALAMLGLSGATKEAKYRGYDGPLFHAKRELAEALRPHQEALAALPYERLWAMICEELCGRSPDLAL
ncbi:MAG TPA: hypothetical protein VFA26_00970, partial [Gemmataceae bacterium]|nr:hypothetical protein [Gemmataceae bacterium]